MDQHAKNLNKIFTFAVGVLFIFLAWQWWNGQTIFASLVAPEASADGTVSVGANGQAMFLMNLLNLLFTAISGVGFTVLTVLLGGVRILVDTFGPLFSGGRPIAPVHAVAPQQPVPAPQLAPVAPQPVPMAPAVQQPPRLPPAQVNDIAKLLVNAAINGEVGLTIALAEKLHGSPYLRKAAKAKAEADAEAEAAKQPKRTRRTSSKKAGA